MRVRAIDKTGPGATNDQEFLPRATFPSDQFPRSFLGTIKPPRSRDVLDLPDQPLHQLARLRHRCHGVVSDGQDRSREDALRERRDELRLAMEDAEKRNDIDRTAVYYGQGAGAIMAVRPAADVMRSICEEAERILGPTAGRPE